MSPDEARRELAAALTRGRRANKKVYGGFGEGVSSEVLVMITEEVAVALLADGDKVPE
jgi:hypothetical protein